MSSLPGIHRLAPLISLGGFLAAWSALAYSGVFPRLLLPAPWDVASAAAGEALSGAIAESLANSMKHYLAGLAWGITAGTAVGLAMGWYRGFEALAEPLVRLFRPIPPLAWIPFAILWLGISHAAAAFLIGLQAFWICLFNSYSGAKSVDRGLVEVAMTFGETSGLGLMKRIVLPASTPYILSAVRISLGQGWLTVIAAELFGIPGVGQRLIEAGMNLAMDVVVVYMALIGAVYYVIDRAYKAVEARLLAWR